MIEIDGSHGEGGGQILRTSVALSAFCGKAVKVFNIRAGRDTPGLRPQHVTGIDAVGKICSAKIEGSSVGSSELFFTPGELKSGDFAFDVGTAGAITLIIQSLLPTVVSHPGEFSLRITGGTDVRWSPQADYLKHVTIPLLNKLGCIIELKVLRRGYYPKGGGLVELKVEGVQKLKEIDLTTRGEVKSISGISHAHSSLKERSVCERQANSAKKYLVDYENVNISCEYNDAFSIGSGITLWADCGNTIIGADYLGARELKAEDVGKKAALDLLSALKSSACLDKFMADQIVPYIALAGGKATIAEATEHAKTNVWVCREFGFDVRLAGNTLSSRL